jgi:hypothetical protein
MGTYTNFCCRLGGSNLNAGTRTGDTTVPGAAPDLTYTGGTWVQASGTFTVAAGDPVADGVAVGDYVSVYVDGATVATTHGRVTARTTTTVTVGTRIGTTADVAGTANLRVGGAWEGPQGTGGFPFTQNLSTIGNAAGNPVRVNFKNDQTHSLTAAVSAIAQAGIFYQGFTTSYGDGGRTTFDGGVAGAAYVLLTINASSTRNSFIDLIFQNNGATGGSGVFGISVNAGACRFIRCTFKNFRGGGLRLAGYTVGVECHFANNNLSNTAAHGGLMLQTGGAGSFTRSTFRGNTGAGAVLSSNELVAFEKCTFDANTASGINQASGAVALKISECDFYGNTVDGIVMAVSGAAVIENSNFVKNGGWAIRPTASGIFLQVNNCGFGQDSQENTLGKILLTASTGVEEVGSIDYIPGTTPWVDPVNGDFRISNEEAQGAGRGTFSVDAGNTLAYPDIGSGQSEPGGGGGTLVNNFYGGGRIHAASKRGMAFGG